jgi:hypothetical protein
MEVHHIFKILFFQGWYIHHFEDITPSISTIQPILMMPCRIGFIIFLHNNALHWWLQYYFSFDHSCHNVGKFSKSWKAFTRSNHWLKAQGYYFMSVQTWAMIRWAWASSISKSFLEYFVDVDKIFLKYSLTHETKYLVTWKNICHVFMDEQYLWMKMWMINEIGWTFSWMLPILFFCEKLNKKNMM